MARTKRIFREWQHPRASNGRFAKKGSPEWVKAAAEKFRNAPDGLKAGTSAPGHPGRPRIARGAKAEAVLAAHDASVTTRLAPHQPVQGPAARPASTARKQLPRTSKEWRVNSENTKQREATLQAVAGGEPTAAEREKARQENLMRGAGSAVVSALDKAKVATRRDNGQTGGVTEPTTLKPGTDAHRRAAADVKIKSSGPGMTPTVDREPQPGDLVYANGLNRAGTVVRSIKRHRTEGYDVQWEGQPYTQHHPTSRLQVVDVAEALRRQRQTPDPDKADMATRADLTSDAPRRLVQGGNLEADRPSESEIEQRYAKADAAIKARKAREAAAAEQGPALGPDLAQSPGAASMASIKNATIGGTGGGAHDYDKMDRATLNILARDARIPIAQRRGKSNGELAAMLHAKDEENKAKKAAKLNPAGVGESSSQHEQHTPLPRNRQLDVGNLPADRGTRKGGYTPWNREGQGGRITVSGDARTRAASPAGLYDRHKGLTREQFDALPETRQRTVLDELRKAVASKEQVPYTLASNRSGFHGATIRGTKDAPHVEGARNKLRELTYTAPPPIDNSIEGRAARLKAGDRYAADGTIEELNQIARAAGSSGFPASWKRQKAVDYLRNQAIAGDRMQAAREGHLATALRGASPAEAMAVMEARDAEYGVTLGEIGTAAKVLGVKLPAGDKRKRMHALAQGAGERSSAPKGDAATSAASGRAARIEATLKALPADLVPDEQTRQMYVVESKGTWHVGQGQPYYLQDMETKAAALQWIVDAQRSRERIRNASARRTDSTPYGKYGSLSRADFDKLPPARQREIAAELHAGRMAQRNGGEDGGASLLIGKFGLSPTAAQRQAGDVTAHPSAIRAAAGRAPSGRIDVAAKRRVLDTPRDKSQTGGVSKAPTTEATMKTDEQVIAESQARRAAVRAALDAATTEREARDAIHGLSKAQLLRLDNEMGGQGVQGSTEDLLRRSIIAKATAKPASTRKPGYYLDGGRNDPPTRLTRVNEDGTSKTVATGPARDMINLLKKHQDAAAKESAGRAAPGEPQLGVTESSKGRTTTVTLPDGTTAQRTSKTMTYTHAVVGTTDEHANARDARQLADRLDAYTAALEAWIAGGSDMSKLEKFDTGTGSHNDAQAGIKHYGYYLPGFEPKQVRTKSGMTYYQSNPDGPTVEYRDLYRDGTLVPIKPGYEKFHGPAAHREVLDRARRQAKSAREEAAKLEAGPRYSYHVPRWSQRADTAFGAIGSPEVNRQNTSYQVVTVGGIAKEDTRPAKVVPTLAERTAAAEARKVADKAASAARTQQFFDEKIKGITDSLNGADSHDPEWHLQMTTEAGLVSLAKHLKVKVANRRQSEYGPRPRNQEEIAKIRQDIVQAVRDRQAPAEAHAQLSNEQIDRYVKQHRLNPEAAQRMRDSFRSAAGASTTETATPSEQAPRSSAFNPRVADGGNLPPKREGETDGMYNIRVAPSDDAAEKQLRGYSIAGLRAILRDAGLPIGGTKDQLVERAMGPRRRYWDSIGIERRGSSPKA